MDTKHGVKGKGKVRRVTKILGQKDSGLYGTMDLGTGMSELGLSKYDYNMILSIIYCIHIVIIFNLYVMCIKDVV